MSAGALCLASPPPTCYQATVRARTSLGGRSAAAAAPPAPSACVPDDFCMEAPDVSESTRIALDLLSAQTAAGWFEWRFGFEAILAAVPGGGHRPRARLTAAFDLYAKADKVRLENTLLVLWPLRCHCVTAGVAAPALGLKPRELLAALAALGPAGHP